MLNSSLSITIYTFVQFPNHELRTMYEIIISKVYSEPYLGTYVQLIYEFVPQRNTLHIKNRILKFWRYLIGYFILIPALHSNCSHILYNLTKNIHIIHEHSMIRVWSEAKYSTDEFSMYQQQTQKKIDIHSPRLGESTSI